MDFTIHGDCEPGYEDVKTKFSENFIAGLDHESSCCIYVGQNKVVDLYG